MKHEGGLHDQWTYFIYQYSMPLPLQVAFVAGSSGIWRIERITAVAGESLPPAERLAVIEGTEAQLDFARHNEQFALYKPRRTQCPER
jgi:hypothetical protein